VWTSTLAAGAVNVGLNLATVPTLGNVAAAVNTAIAYAVLLGLLVAYQYRVARTPIPLAWRRIATALAVMGIGLGCAILLLPDEAPSVITLAGRTVVLLVVTATLWALFVRGPRRPNTSRGPC
jgi:peptidoglycan biosynthesis protein MviN/MurJ (putative lipid II flippase)